MQNSLNHDALNRKSTVCTIIKQDLVEPNHGATSRKRVQPTTTALNLSERISLE